MAIRFFSNHNSDNSVLYSASVTNINHGDNIEISLLAPEMPNPKILGECASCNLYVPDATLFDVASCSGVEHLDTRRAASFSIMNIIDFGGELVAYLSTIKNYLAHMTCQNEDSRERIYRIIENGLCGKER